MTVSDPSSVQYQRTMVAVLYALGVRGDDLIAPLVTPSDAARELRMRLDSNDRGTRARVLAPELARLVQCLDRRKLR